MGLCRNRSVRALLILSAAAALFVLFRFDPARNDFFPDCLFHTLTGLHCPGCGSTRAVHQLLQGHVGAALALNPLLVLLIPLLLGAWLLQKWRRTNGRPNAPLFSHPRVGWTIAVVVIAFGVLRNVPVDPFTRLAP